ncbi:MAG TPA: calcium-binding protein [Microvirga sp.]|nr:calcium-binding protein [Microvirga sp.]
MASSSQSLRYVFYGGVEGAYQNQDIDDPRYLSLDYGATVGDYEEGELITGFIELSGDALAIANSVPRGTEFVLSASTPGIDFFFEQPRVGDYTEANISTDIRMTLGAGGAPLSGLSLRVFDGGDGPNVTIGPTFVDIRDDNEAQARVDGLWLPENVTPLVLSGTDGNDTLRGTTKYNFLAGGLGDDSLFLKTGQGWIWGGLGNDSIKGHDKGDFLFGGYGNDKILGRGGDDVIRGGDGQDDVRGERGNDTVDGGSGNDSVKGGSGNDTLGGQHGNDRMFGNDGRDTIRGGHGDDTIDAGSGDDWIYGGWGDDVLKGGPGSDTFLFSSGDGGGRDTVTDFRPGVDFITIENDLFETFQQMLAEYTEQVGRNVQITYALGPEGSVITLTNIKIAELRASDFGFSPNG